ncbi:MAG: element excision factor XisI family protein [Cyanobacteria bacterium J06626_18]
MVADCLKCALSTADYLVELGVPKQDIVLVYHAPNVRKYTEFALG